jgi:hypothetical protein
MAALSAIRLLARLIAALAAAVGVIYAVTAVVGPSVLWLVPSSVQQPWSLIALPLPWRIAHAAAVLLGAITVAAIATLVADLSGRVRRGVEFVPAVSRTVWSLAIVLAAGSWLTSIAENLAGHAALVYPGSDGPDLGFAAIDTLPIDWGFGLSTFTPDFAMLGLAVTMGLLAWITGSGERLQRDLNGLV